MNTPLENLLDWYQNLTPETLLRLDEFYTEDAYFKDPFNEIRSRRGIRQIYSHMFSTLENPRFVIKSTVTEGRQTFAVWNMEFFFRGKAMAIHGCTHFTFAADGRVQSHRDYWDAAEEFYEKLPILGWLLRRLRRRIQKQTME